MHILVPFQSTVCDQLKFINQLIDSGTGEGVLTVEIRGEDGVKNDVQAGWCDAEVSIPVPPQVMSPHRLQRSQSNDFASPLRRQPPCHHRIDVTTRYLGNDMISSAGEISHSIL